jgi:CMP-2-keto-3-deoxyoctulosonic acid synthetase
MRSLSFFNIKLQEEINPQRSDTTRVFNNILKKINGKFIIRKSAQQPQKKTKHTQTLRNSKIKNIVQSLCK